MTDDLDGGDAEETVSFALDGSAFDIDLSTKNAERLREELAPFVAAARRTGSRSAPRRGSARASGGAGAGDRTNAIRVWAREQGHEVSDRGRIAKAVIEAYDAAH